VEVSATANWCRENYSCSIDGLKYVGKVASTGNFFDKNRGEAPGTQFFVNAEKVDF